MTPLSPSEFFAKIWPTKLLTKETLELRFLERSTGVIKRSFSSSLSEVLSNVQKYRAEDKYDIYFGVATRLGEEGKKRNCYRSHVVWCDLDKPHHKVGTFYFPSPKPDIIVDSGGGIHAYWILNQPQLLIGGRHIDVEAVNRALSKKLDGDGMALDASRILRVPGTYNMKYDPKRQVKAYAL